MNCNSWKKVNKDKFRIRRFLDSYIQDLFVASDKQDIWYFFSKNITIEVTETNKINSLNSPLSHWDPIQPESQLHSNGWLQDPCWHPGLGTQIEQSEPSHPIWQAQWSGALHSPLMHPLMSSWNQTRNPESTNSDFLLLKFAVLIWSKQFFVF